MSALLASLAAAAAVLTPQQGAAGEAAPPAGDVLVVLEKGAATATLVDPATGEVVARLPTGEGPHEGAVSPDGRTCVVTDYGAGRAGSTLTVLDLDAREVRGTIELGRYGRPHGLAFVGDDRVLVTAEAARALVEVDLAEGEVVRAVETGEEVSHMVAVTPDGRRAFVANIGSGTCSVVDLGAFELVATVETGAGAEGVAVTPDGAEVWVTNREAGTITALDAESLAPLATIPCDGFPIRIAFTPDGTRALVTAARAGEVVVLDVPERRVEERVPIELDLADGAEEGLFGDRFGRSPIPIGVLVHPEGDEAYVACAAANRVAVLDLDAMAVVRTLEVGREPDGMALRLGER